MYKKQEKTPISLLCQEKLFFKLSFNPPKKLEHGGVAVGQFPQIHLIVSWLPFLPQKLKPQGFCSLYGVLIAGVIALNKAIGSGRKGLLPLCVHVLWKHHFYGTVCIGGNAIATEFPLAKILFSCWFQILTVHLGAKPCQPFPSKPCSFYCRSSFC